MNSPTLKQEVKKKFDSAIAEILRDYETGRIVSKIEDDGIDVTYVLKFGHLKQKDEEAINEIKSVFGKAGINLK